MKKDLYLEAGIRLCSRSQTRLHTSCGFSLNVRQQCDACTFVLPSHAGQSQDGHVDLQDCRKCGCASVVELHW